MNPFGLYLQLLAFLDIASGGSRIENGDLAGYYERLNRTFDRDRAGGGQ
jgi:hypothetical protein